MQYLNAFLLGGFLCAVGQILIDKTKLTPARILVLYVVAGALLTGFGYALAQGVKNAVNTDGWLGIFTGGLTATAGGVAAAVILAFLAALLSRPGEKT